MVLWIASPLFLQTTFSIAMHVVSECNNGVVKVIKFACHMCKCAHTHTGYEFKVDLQQPTISRKRHYKHAASTQTYIARLFFGGPALTAALFAQPLSAANEARCMGSVARHIEASEPCTASGMDGGRARRLMLSAFPSATFSSAISTSMSVGVRALWCVCVSLGHVHARVSVRA